MCGSMGIARSISQRAGNSWLEPSVRFARPWVAPVGVRLASFAISADFVSP